MTTGSVEAILYSLFQLVDEIFHAIGLDNFDFGVRFCQWTHRKD